MRTFFRFLISENPSLSGITNIADITLGHIEMLKPVDIEEYMEYLKLYYYDGQKYTNDEHGMHRKLASRAVFTCITTKGNLLKTTQLWL